MSHLIEINIDEIVEKAAEKIIDKLMPTLELKAARAVFPRTVKGHEKAGELLGIGAKAMNMRLMRGEYQEGVHYEKKSAKIFMWNRDALLDAELSKRSKG